MGIARPVNEVLGTNNAETLLGSSGVDSISGLGGADQLLGEERDDSLYGGDGNDILIGGAGGDVLNGGAGIDRAQYSDATAGVLVDLQNAALNTGFAAGDTFVSVEQLYGSRFDDNLRGDAGANTLWGHDGNDRLYGRSGNDNLQGMNGNDSLYGGSGNDWLVGGVGTDLLDGGEGADTFEFREALGGDRIFGFQDDIDSIRLDDAIWSGGLSAAQVASTYGSVVSGSCVLDFGGGNTITLVGFGNLAALVDDFIFF